MPTIFRLASLLAVLLPLATATVAKDKDQDKDKKVQSSMMQVGTTAPAAKQSAGQNTPRAQPTEKRKKAKCKDSRGKKTEC